MKKLLFTIIALASMLFAADFNVWKNSTLHSIVQKGELRVCLEPGYVPFEMRDKHGRIIGFDVDSLAIEDATEGEIIWQIVEVPSELILIDGLTNTPLITETGEVKYFDEEELEEAKKELQNPRIGYVI